MTVLRFDPFQEFDRLSRQMLGSGRGPRSMPMEAYRRSDQFFIHLDLPGANPDDLQLTVERNVVAVRAERRSLWQEGDEVLVDETPQGTFGRQLFLGDNLDAGRLEASFDQGILTLTVPVAEQAKPRRYLRGPVALRLLARCAGSQGRGRAGLSRTGRSPGAAQRQSWIVANVVHIACAGGEAQELVGLVEQRRRALPAEGQPIGDAAAGEQVVADRGRRLLRCRRLIALHRRPAATHRGELGRPCHIAAAGQPDLGGAGAGPIGVEPEPGQPGSDLEAADAPAPRQGIGARHERRRGHGLGLQHKDRLAAIASAGDPLVLAGDTTGHDHGAGDHRRSHGEPPAGLGRAGAEAELVHATTAQF
jgi:HSP20 family protein